MTYRYSLDTTSKKFICPNCNEKRFVKYVDNFTNKFLHKDVGRCDREQSCGYHYSPKQYFNDNKHLIPESDT